MLGPLVAVLDLRNSPRLMQLQTNLPNPQPESSRITLTNDFEAQPGSSQLQIWQPSASPTGFLGSVFSKGVALPNSVSFFTGQSCKPQLDTTGHFKQKLADFPTLGHFWRSPTDTFWLEPALVATRRLRRLHRLRPRLVLGQAGHSPCRMNAPGSRAAGRLRVWLAPG